MMRKLDIKVIDIITFLGSDILAVFGEFDNTIVKYLKEPKEVDIFTLDWINSTNSNKQILAENSKAKVLIVNQEVHNTESIKNQNKILIQVENPRLAVSLVAQYFFAPKLLSGIDPNAVIDPKAVISATAFIGAGCVLGECIVGKNTIIHPNVTIYDDVNIGDNCLIQAGSVIGTDGLGCQRLSDGTLVKFPHLGGVRIGNNVEIGANSQIARGALSNTIIGHGTKINGLCFIAHNCILEENVWITGNTMLAGSVKVQKNVTLYSGVIIREQVTIGAGAIVGMGSVVTKDVPVGETWIGNPAKKK